jgi:hypothetical protein
MKQQHTTETRPVPHLGILDLIHLDHPSSQISNKSLQPVVDGRVDLPFVMCIQALQVFEMQEVIQQMNGQGMEDNKWKEIQCPAPLHSIF